MREDDWNAHGWEGERGEHGGGGDGGVERGANTRATESGGGGRTVTRREYKVKTRRVAAPMTPVATRLAMRVATSTGVNGSVAAAR